MKNEKKIKTGYTSIDLPYLEYMPKMPSNFSFENCRKTAFQFVWDSTIKHSCKWRKLPAFNFYGRKITNEEFYYNTNVAGNAFLNRGASRDDVISMFQLNIPETYYSMYGLNDFGYATEWFNPLTMTEGLLKDHIKKNNVKTIVAIDVMYPLLKKAIQNTNVEQVIITSVQDSFPLNMNILYFMQVFGLNSLLKNPIYQNAIKKIEGIIPEERATNNLTIAEQKNTLKKYQQFLFKLNAYAKKEKIQSKASFYQGEHKDERFILWNDFIKEYGELNWSRRKKYEEDKTKFIVHTGGTTGPAKDIAHTDFAINAAVYQTVKMPLGLEFEDTFCQIVPPFVAYPLESMHMARYMQMETHLITTYDREEFPKILLKKKINHYNIVPSFAIALTENEKVKNADLSFVKSVQYGGEGISVIEDEKVDKLVHGKGRHGFGQNEVFGVFTGNYEVENVKKAYGCCGFPLFGNRYIIVDSETNEELKYGKDANGNYRIGELYIYGPATMKGYIRESEKENEKKIIYRDGLKYVKTGDQAYIDEYGRLYYYTREERIIRTQQGKIFTNVIENILQQIPEVAECCVVKSPHPTNVAEASCHIVLKPECWINKEFVIDKIIKKVEEETKKMYSYYVPGTYEFTQEHFLRTPFGKIDFRLLEKENIEAYEQNGGLALQKIRIK